MSTEEPGGDSGSVMTRWRRRNPERARELKAREVAKRHSRDYYTGQLPYKRERNDRTREHAEHHREPWDQYEDEIVLAQEHKDIVLALILGRTESAVIHRRYRLKARIAAESPVQSVPVGAGDPE